MRLLLGAAYVGYLLCVGYLVFTPGGDTPGGAIQLALDLVHTVGVDASTSQMEVSLNVVMFVPLSLVGRFVLGRAELWFWIAGGVGLSALIEIVQLGIPGRVSTVKDVVANTAGAAAGSLMALGLSAWGKRDR